MFEPAADNGLKVETENVCLPGIENLWTMEMPRGKRWVVIL